MHLRTKSIYLAILVFGLLPARPVFADDLSQVLQKLDAAAKNFHTTAANFEFDTIQTDPIPDTDVQTGVAYYERAGNNFQMAAHIHEHNKGVSHKIYMLSGGTLKISETGKEQDAKRYDQARKYESYLMLGFGASGADLESKWNIKFLDSEMLDGVKTDKLELVAKDPSVRRTISKVTIWLDPTRAVSLKDVFDEGEGQSFVCTYSNIKVNQPLPSDAFAFNK